MFEYEKLIYLIQNSIKNTINSTEYVQKNSLVLEKDKNFNTDDFIIFENNRKDGNKDSYHFFYLNHPLDYDKNTMYIKEKYQKSKINLF